MPFAGVHSTKRLPNFGRGDLPPPHPSCIFDVLHEACCQNFINLEAVAIGSLTGGPNSNLSAVFLMNGFISNRSMSTFIASILEGREL